MNILLLGGLGLAAVVGVSLLSGDAEAPKPGARAPKPGELTPDQVARATEIKLALGKMDDEPVATVPILATSSAPPATTYEGRVLRAILAQCPETFPEADCPDHIAGVLVSMIPHAAEGPGAPVATCLVLPDASWAITLLPPGVDGAKVLRLLTDDYSIPGGVLALPGPGGQVPQLSG